MGVGIGVGVGVGAIVGRGVAVGLGVGVVVGVGVGITVGTSVGVGVNHDAIVVGGACWVSTMSSAPPAQPKPPGSNRSRSFIRQIIHNWCQPFILTDVCSLAYINIQKLATCIR